MCRLRRRARREELGVRTATCEEQDDSWGQMKEGECAQGRWGAGWRPDWVGQCEVVGIQMSQEALAGA